MHAKGSGLGFVHVPAWEALVQQPMWRRQTRAHRGQGSFYYGDLWKFLYQHLPKEPTCKVHFGQTIDALSGTSAPIKVQGQDYGLVILTDGGFSKLRKYVLAQDPSQDDGPQPEYAGYVVWRGSVPVSQLPKNILYSIEEGVYKSGIYDTIVLKMARDDGTDHWTLGTFIATPEHDITSYWNKATDGASRHGDDNQTNVPDWFASHMRQHFSHVPGLVPLVDHMLAHGEMKPHPQYEFGAIDQVHRGRVVLLGDAAHMASPRTAVGAHTAILDALALRDAFHHIPLSWSKGNNTTDDTSLQASSIDRAIAYYSKSGVERAQELYQRTREVSAQFVPKAGLASVVSPQQAVQDACRAVTDTNAW
jgi:2-polyprenyl-6-methoxyphenol hydroxylase-like FAD-dependent oxidoreductase